MAVACTSLSLSLVFRDLRRVSSLAHQASAACHTALVLRMEEQIQDTGGDKHSSSGKRRHPALRSFCFDAADISGTVRKSKMPRRKTAPGAVQAKPGFKPACITGPPPSTAAGSPCKQRTLWVCMRREAKLENGSHLFVSRSCCAEEGVAWTAADGLAGACRALQAFSCRPSRKRRPSWSTCPSRISPPPETSTLCCPCPSVEP